MNRAQTPGIRIFPDIPSLSQAGADHILSAARRVLASRERFSLALSGGSTPAPLYRLLGAAAYRDSMPWRGMHIYWADERCVAADHPDSNYKLAFDAFLSRVPIPPGNVHRIRGEEDPERAARIYEEELGLLSRGGPLPAFDLVLLGVGEDGHTASLFPAAAELQEKERRAVPVYPEPPKQNRVTLTLPVLNNASDVLFLVSGTSKAAIVHEIIGAGNPNGLPAGLVRPVHGTVSWMLDREAAAALAEPGRAESGKHRMVS